MWHCKKCNYSVYGPFTDSMEFWNCKHCGKKCEFIKTEKVKTIDVGVYTNEA